MKQIFLTIVTCLLLMQAQAQLLRSFTPRYNNASMRGNIRYVSNNYIGSNSNTGETPPGGTGTNNGDAGYFINVDPYPGTELIPWNSTWKFCDSGYTPVAGALSWKDVGYPDGTWTTATAGLPTDARRDIGYGDNPDDQVLPYVFSGCGGGVPGNGVQLPGGCSKYITTYFRKDFTIASVATFPAMVINMHRDDGVVVYINGNEVSRSNMPAGVVTNTTLAPTAVDGADENVSITVPNTYFVNGTNTIAVELHQANATSSDISFRLQLLGSEIFTSSSADLALPACAQVQWAGLYWGATEAGDPNDSSWINNEEQARIKIPGSAVYQNITADEVDYHNNVMIPSLTHNGYRAFKDITSLINSTTPNGTYTLANMAGPSGYNNASGGWTIVVVYSNPTDIPRNLTVFDGSAIINYVAYPVLEIPITGFLTPPTGPVACELGAVTYDGDRAALDGFFFKQDANPLVGTYTNLTPNGAAFLDDMWNSTITYKGVNVTTRNPMHQNTMGYDADILELNNTGNSILGNNANSGSVQVSSANENFFVQVVTTAIATYNPSFAVEKGSTDLNGGTLVGGDVVRYHMNYENVGIDVSTNSVLTDNIPTATSFVPGSIRINGVSKTDAAGDDEAEYDYVTRQVIFRLGTGANAVSGGTVAVNGTGTVDFQVYAASACQILACGTPTDNIARIDYVGQTSGNNLFDSSGYLLGGCLTKGPISNVITGGCYTARDTVLNNLCPSLSVMLPAAKFAGYSFYSAMPFNAANSFNYTQPITASGVYYAYFNSGGAGCSDTITIRVYINPCPDIDDDDDGITDAAEGGGSNPSADDDNDGIENYKDNSFPGFTDADNNGVNDAVDADGDGIPNHLDRDSDNDGIPDVVEAGGVDVNGDGVIDNYSDADGDGLSDNVDASNTGEAGSGNGLGTPDRDGDGIPNYVDLDSDNDGIPDVVEVYGADANNDGRLDYTSGFNVNDLDGDGFTDAVDGDANNDNIAENTAAALLTTGIDGNNDGRADNYPSKNRDNDAVANPYDLDSDGDGINDVREAGLVDANNDGRSDGTRGADGWDDAVDALVVFALPDTDAAQRPNAYDIDSDDDGIPDNIEGLPTNSYLLPSGADADGDGIDNTYDSFNGFGGNGITPVNTDGDGQPDYTDMDTDGDGAIDRVEGNDFNLNQLSDDNVTLLGTDSDDDGLDDRFDSSPSHSGTSAYMGNGGTTTGDPAPGSSTMVQKSWAANPDRDWRYLPYVLNLHFIRVSASLHYNTVQLNWVVKEEEPVSKYIVQQSVAGKAFTDRLAVNPKGSNGSEFTYEASDVSSIQGSMRYRIKALGMGGGIVYSPTVTVLAGGRQASVLQLLKNPVARGAGIQAGVRAGVAQMLHFSISTLKGQTVYTGRHQVLNGQNTLYLQGITQSLTPGTYLLSVQIDNVWHNQKFVVQ